MVDMKKEKEPFINRGRESVPEEKPLVEAKRSKEDIAKDNLEVSSWVEKIEKKFARVPNQTSDVTDDSVVVQQPQSQQPPVTLPVNQQQMKQGKNASTDTGIAWLVAWVVRQIKMITLSGRKVRFQDIPEVTKEKVEQK